MSPSDMIEDQPVRMDHVRAIEVTMDKMKSQHEATHQLLQDVLARLSPTQAQNVQDPLPTRPACGFPTPSIPASSAGWKKLTLKPSFPPDFSGDWAAGKAFLTSCRTYIRLCPEAVRGTPSASDSRPSSASASDSRPSSASTSAPATLALFRNAFGRMTSYATRS